MYFLGRNIRFVAGAYYNISFGFEMKSVELTYRYRRGKLESNDVDVVFTHPRGERMEEVAADLCTKLVLRLKLAGVCISMPSRSSELGLLTIRKLKGLVTHVMRAFLYNSRTSHS